IRDVAGRAKRWHAALAFHGHAAEGGAPGGSGGPGTPARRPRVAAGSRSGCPYPRADGRDAAGGSRFRRPPPAPGARRRDARSLCRRALRRVRLPGGARDRTLSTPTAPPGVRPGAPRHAGRPRGDRGPPVRRLDQRAPRAAARPPAPRLSAALPGRATLARERLLPRMGPPPGAAGDALRRGLRVLQGEPR